MSQSSKSQSSSQKKRIVISECDNIAAIMEDDRAVEFIIHRGDILLGDVFLTTVENILPSIDAAFVNVGSDKMGFLHASDVPGKGDLKERLQPKQQLVVQVMKEPTGHKGPRVTTNISLPGRFLVMMPESKGISISRKIADPKERSRLKSIVSLVKPPGVGVIIRTESEGQKESDIQEDFEVLLERWQNIVSMADTAQPPSLLYRDQDLLYRVIREAVTDDVDELVVDSTFGQQRAQQLLQNWNLDKNIKVTHYTGAQPMLIGTGVDREIRQALQTKVPLPSGGYLYIQPTEALAVIDVNSGKFTSLDSQAATIRQTNLEACKEIARQLRLRNIGGMIIVDFIDMESRADQLAVLESFENELSPDKSKPQIGQLSDLGLVEMTRHRQGQALSEIFTRKCIACNGTGHAIEDFNWAPRHMQPDHKHQGGGRFGRQKLPLKYDRNQRVPRPQATVQQQQHQHRGGGRYQRGERGRDRQREQQQRQRGQEAAAMTTLASRFEEEKRFQPPTVGNLFITKVLDGRSNGYVPNIKDLSEYYGDRVLHEFGVKLGHVTKLAVTPPESNNILSRINPRATDILTLIQVIEEAPAIPIRGERGRDRDHDREDSGRRRRGRSDDVEDEAAEDEETAKKGGAVAVEVRPPEEEKEEAEEEKKPRRGRPPKADKAESAEDTGKDEEQDAKREDEKAGSADSAPKKRRGRPPKKSNNPRAKKSD